MATSWRENDKSSRTSIWSFIFMIIVIAVMFVYGSYFYETRDVAKTHELAKNLFRSMGNYAVSMLDRKKADTSNYVDSIKPAFTINK